MPWGAAVGAVVGSVANKALSSDKNGGAGTQTTDKAPWLMAQPWILNNLASGQALQDKYTAQPFSPQQQAAYDNSYLLSDSVRAQVPALLQQLGGQQVGFDKSNPTAKPQAWDWTALLQGLQGQKSVTEAKPTPAPADTSSKKTGDFVNLDVTNPLNAYYGQLLSQNGIDADGGMWNADFLKAAGGAGYGSFKYGMATPQPGTQAYRDMQEYLSYGGADPYNLYGKRAVGLLGGGNGPGVSVGDGVGVAGSAASVGSSANF